MNALLLAVLVMQVKVEAVVQRDSATQKKQGMVVNIDYAGRKREPRRIPVTEEHRRTAFRSSLARAMLARARVARLAQDSALVSYDAAAYLRISAGMGFSKIGRDRLMFRHENATRVRWHRDVGAWIDVKGARTVIPIASKEEQEEEAADIVDDSDMTPVPYFPGYEPLLSFNGSGVVKSTVDERDMVHPIAEGAEAYYLYEAGDSVTFRLPDGRAIELRELRVRPREPKWNVAVGSLWFDTRTGQLVRAAYRLAVPMDIWEIVEEEERRAAEEKHGKAKDDVPVWVKAMVSPMRAQVNAVAVEYGLYQGRFWLPRLRSAEGGAQAGFMRMPFKFEQSFRYASVNAIDSLPVIQIAVVETPPDSLSQADRDNWRDSVREARTERRRAQRDSVRKGLLTDRSPCDSSGTRLVTHRRRDANLAVAMRIPCDISSLWNSPDLPKSIYDEGEEIFGIKERDALIQEALSLGAQPPMTLGAVPPTLRWGLEFTRFNRIEGLSSALLVEQQLGGGYTASLLGRIGHADLEPNAELTLARSNLVTTVRGRAYHRLVHANDWGNPLSFGSSVSAFLFGRDEGFYYRASGAELEVERESDWSGGSSALLTWRLFAERERTAVVENPFSLGPKFIPNIVAREGKYAGTALRLVHSKGLDANGFRTFTDLRVESAISDSASSVYWRGALDLTLTKGFGPAAAALTMSGGAGANALPMQRRWFLSGAHTVRGQRADTAQSGNAYWLGRFELGTPMRALRPVMFGDIGWIGDRSAWRDVGRPMSGVGVGASVLDGLIRFDVSRGLYPQRRVRIDMYLDAKF